MRAASLALLAALILSPAARAEPPAENNAGAAPIQGDAVYLAFHGKAGIERIVGDMMNHNQSDPRISDIFRAADTQRLRVQLTNQFCYLLGGPCVYDGLSMKEAHKDMGLQDTDLNALVENLQNAMDREGVPFSDQNRLLAKLAPMRRDVVVR